MRRDAKRPRAWAVLLLALAAALAVAPAVRAQDSDVAERLERLERDLNMLQRQVYGGGYRGDAQAGGGSNLAVHVEIRMQRLDEEMRRLTGRVEDAMNAIRELRQRIDAISTVVGDRYNGPAAGPLPRAVDRRPPAPAAAKAGAEGNAVVPPPPAPPAELAPPGSSDESGTLFPPPSAPDGRPPPPEGAPTRAQTANMPEDLAPPGGALPHGSALSQYSRAFGLLKSADYDGAGRAMKAFVQDHPDDPLAANAQYWLGETYYVRGLYDEAARAFAAGYKNYPNSAKAPEDLLKLAMSLSRAKQKQNACVAFAQLRRTFPHPGTAIAERAAGEEKRLGC